MQSESYFQGYLATSLHLDKKPKCTPGNKPCGDRCIPVEQECHVGEVVKSKLRQSKPLLQKTGSALRVAGGATFRAIQTTAALVSAALTINAGFRAYQQFQQDRLARNQAQSPEATKVHENSTEQNRRSTQQEEAESVRKGFNAWEKQHDKRHSKLTREYKKRSDDFAKKVSEQPNYLGSDLSYSDLDLLESSHQNLLASEAEWHRRFRKVKRADSSDSEFKSYLASEKERREAVQKMDREVRQKRKTLRAYMDISREVRTELLDPSSMSIPDWHKHLGVVASADPPTVLKAYQQQMSVGLPDQDAPSSEKLMRILTLRQSLATYARKLRGSL